MGHSQKLLTRVETASIFVIGLYLENFPWKLQIFQCFSYRFKKYLFIASQKYARVGSVPISSYFQLMPWGKIFENKLIIICCIFLWFTPTMSPTQDAGIEFRIETTWLHPDSHFFTKSYKPLAKN